MLVGFNLRAFFISTFIELKTIDTMNRSLNLFSIFCLLILFSAQSFAQLRINEIQTSNTQTIADEDQQFNDWIELFNSGNEELQLNNYILSDKKSDSLGWQLPNFTLPGRSHLLVFASGKDRKLPPLYWKTLIQKGDEWKFSTSFKTGWREPKFNDSSWSTGKSGFGYGDNDDETILNNGIQAVYIRKKFQIENLDHVTQLVLHVDYDDAFIAFINGKEVARSYNITSSNNEHSVVSVNPHREAQLYTGGKPDAFVIQLEAGLLVEGENCIAIQGHNNSTTSSDFSLIPMLSISQSDFTQNELPDYIEFPKNELHTNFKLKSEGESVYLLNSDGTIADSLTATALSANKSFGRYPDGADDWFYFLSPTPNVPNNNPSESLPPDTVFFSQPAGFTNETVYVSLWYDDPSCQIRYTTNGSAPTASSPEFLEPIEIAKTTVLRAAAFSNEVQMSSTCSNSYIFNTQYQLPVISIASAPENFFDYNKGIFEMGPNASAENPNYGANFWNDWEIPVHIELFSKEKTSLLDQGAGLKVTGNWSRAKPQKSVALFARKNYGSGSFKQKLFNDRASDSYETFILRNSGNDWEYTMFRDGLISHMARSMDVDRLAYQPTVVYINGQHWGILNMREKPNEHYFANNYGYDPEEINIAENNASPVEGSVADYQQTINFIQNKSTLSDPDLVKLRETLDLESFIDYEVIQIFVNNRDWPGNNIKYWKANHLNSRWRWILFDTDFGFGLYNQQGYNEYTMNFVTTTTGPSWPNPAWSTLLLRKLLTNKDFKEQFITRFADCLNTNLSSNAIYPLIDSIQTLINSDMRNHLQRWSRDFSNWNWEVNRLKTFAQYRPDYMRNDLSSFFNNLARYNVNVNISAPTSGSIELNTLTLNTFPFSGTYFQSVPVRLKARPNPGFKFIKWEGDVTASTQEINFTPNKNTTLRAVFEPIQPETPKIVINEICFNDKKPYNTSDWVELYNAGTQTIDLSNWVLMDDKVANAFKIPAGTLIYAGDFLVISTSRLNFKRVYPKMKTLGDMQLGLSSTSDLLTLFDATGKLIDHVNYNTYAPWPNLESANGATLELTKPLSDNALASNWKLSIGNGTPNAPNSTLITTVQQLAQQVQAYCFPTYFNQFTTLHFKNEAMGPFKVEISNLNGAKIGYFEGSNSESQHMQFDLFTDLDAAPGMYVVKVTTTEGIQTIKVIKK